MSGDLDNLYLPWLAAQVGSVKVRRSVNTHWTLLRQLYTKKFSWFVPNDDNRVEDGRDLRDIFADELHIAPSDAWMDLECSFLELLIGLARRLAFEAEGEPAVWFWHMVENLGLDACTDGSRYSQEEVDARLDAVIQRTYEPSGHGGIFPLRHTTRDQRQVELWYQLNEYLTETG